MAWLSRFGRIRADRLEAHGYGPTRPISRLRTNRGRALNRRVEFNIVEPQCSGSPHAAPAPGAPPTTATDGNAGRESLLRGTPPARAAKSQKGQKVTKRLKAHERLKAVRAKKGAQGVRGGQRGGKTRGKLRRKPRPA
jgi:hypothetical protein